MAEVVSLITAGTGVLGLFNSCVTEFDYIQLGRHIGRDFRTCHLSLNLAKLRLSRWGHSVDIYENPVFRGRPTTKSFVEAEATLKQIEGLFRDLEKKSGRYSLGTQAHGRDSSQDGISENDILTGPYQEIYARVRALTAQDLEWNVKARLGMKAKVKWALHDAKAFERLLSHVSQLISHLEVLFPDSRAKRFEEATKYVEGMDSASLVALRTAAVGVDDSIVQAIMQRDTMTGENSVGIAVLTEDASFFVGNEYSDGVMSSSNSRNDAQLRSLITSNRNRVDRLEAGNQSVTYIGSRFGGPSVVELALANRSRRK